MKCRPLERVNMRIVIAHGNTAEEQRTSSFSLEVGRTGGKFHDLMSAFRFLRQQQRTASFPGAGSQIFGYPTVCAKVTN